MASNFFARSKSVQFTINTCRFDTFHLNFIWDHNVKSEGNIAVVGFNERLPLSLLRSATNSFSIVCC